MKSNRNNKWIEDIEQMSIELPKKHKKLFFNNGEENFFKEIETLKRNVHHLDDYEIKVQIAKIVASIGDAHTSVNMQINLFCPLELYWFPDGLYVISTISEYMDILNCKIIKVNNIEIDKVISILSKIVSHENQSYLRAQLPKYFPAIELLYALKIADKVHSLELILEDKNGKTRKVEIESLTLREAMEKLNESKSYILSNINLPLYRKDPDKYYWFEYIETFKTVYFKYNGCKDMENKDVFTFTKELIEFINENPVEKLVIDIRNNFGGNSLLLDPFIESIEHLEKINKKGKLFVIVGRETFSSALLNAFSLKENTNAIFLGEATGGKPNCYGEVERFNLKHSGITVVYSTKYYELIEDDNLPSFMPDVYKEVTIENYIRNEDPSLEYALRNF